MKQGVIIDLTDSYAIVLTADGHFVKTLDVKSHYQIGEEISFSAAEAERSSFPKRTGLLGLQQLRIGFITAIAIILIFFSLYPVFNSDKVYAYMTIDINPSFELAINGNMEVIQLDPLNEEGEKLLSSFPDWSKKRFQSVIDSIISQSQSMGYVKNGKNILITTVIDHQDDHFRKILLNQVQSVKNSYVKNKLSIETLQSDMMTRNKALAEGISTGAYIKNQKATDEPDNNQEQKEPERKNEPAPKPDSPEKPASEKNNTNSHTEDGERPCVEPSCKKEPQPKKDTNKPKPDPDAVKEMEKKAKQPPSVPPKREAAPEHPESDARKKNEKKQQKDDKKKVYPPQEDDLKSRNEDSESDDERESDDEDSDDKREDGRESDDDEDDGSNDSRSENKRDSSGKEKNKQVAQSVHYVSGEKIRIQYQMRKELEEDRGYYRQVIRNQEKQKEN
ncbi:anti-sigma-I factor RsgI family protein [Metabacillus sp. 84]|uniref:anti-sigma factor domain-containing protein n=1 Tax=unclassified Metabacillus TaxID=2675274 RepID=UPI003CEDF08D